MVLRSRPNHSLFLVAMCGRCAPAEPLPGDLWQTLHSARSIEARSKERNELTVRRALLSILILGVILAWIVLSYAPATWLPHWQWPTAILPWFGVLLAVGALAFLAIQVWIVYATDKALTGQPDAMREFKLKRGREMLLTALPIAMTVLLILAALPSVRALF